MALQAGFADSDKSWSVDIADVDKASLIFPSRTPTRLKKRRCANPLTSSTKSCLDTESAETLIALKSYWQFESASIKLVR
ncbi:MAG: hypothetical protein R3E95_04540 [Thiolinea sp.]